MWLEGQRVPILMMLVCNSGDYDGVNGDNKDFQSRGYAPTLFALSRVLYMV